MSDEPSPQPVNRVEQTKKNVVTAEYNLLTDIRDLAVKLFKLRLARDTRPQDTEVTTAAAQSYRLAQRKVNSLVEDLCEQHINAIVALSEERAEEQSP